MERNRRHAGSHRNPVRAFKRRTQESESTIHPCGSS